MNTEAVIFEQPLNEYIRICLRLEFLFAQTEHFINGQTEWDYRFATTSILEILNIVDRPDLKNKLGQALNQFSSALLQLETKPNVDKQKLDETIHQLDAKMDLFHQTQGKIGKDLRENEFLFAISQRLYQPAGTCGFNIPAYYLWLKQPAAIKKRTFTTMVRTIYSDTFNHHFIAKPN